MAIEIVDFPIKNGEFPLLCKRSPEGKGQLISDLDIQHMMFLKLLKAIELRLSGAKPQ